MQPTTETGSAPRNLFTSGSVATEPRGSAKLRKVLFGAALVAVPVGVGAVVGLLARSRRAGLIAGGITAAGLIGYRWQLERSFNDEPEYEVEQRIGDIEIRRYPARVEARVSITGEAIDGAIEKSFKRLASYIFGANSGNEKLGMTTPVVARRAGVDHQVSFVMPIHRTLSSLPAPEDPAITVVEVPSQRIAVTSFRGRRKAELIEHQVEETTRIVREAGLEVRGDAAYAGFDPPWTLPVLRRNEIWVVLA